MADFFYEHTTDAYERKAHETSPVVSCDTIKLYTWSIPKEHPQGSRQYDSPNPRRPSMPLLNILRLRQENASAWTIAQERYTNNVLQNRLTARRVFCWKSPGRRNGFESLNLLSAIGSGQHRLAPYLRPSLKESFSTATVRRSELKLSSR